MSDKTLLVISVAIPTAHANLVGMALAHLLGRFQDEGMANYLLEVFEVSQEEADRVFAERLAQWAPKPDIPSAFRGALDGLPG